MIRLGVDSALDSRLRGLERDLSDLRPVVDRGISQARAEWARVFRVGLKPPASKEWQEKKARQSRPRTTGVYTGKTRDSLTRPREPGGKVVRLRDGALVKTTTTGALLMKQGPYGRRKRDAAKLDKAAKARVQDAMARRLLRDLR